MVRTRPSTPRDLRRPWSSSTWERARPQTKLDIDIQHSDEATANFATVSAPVLNTINPRLLALTNADANTAIVGYLNLAVLKRYLKPVDTLNANSQAYGMSVILFGPNDSVKTNDTNQPYEPDGTA